MQSIHKSARWPYFSMAALTLVLICLLVPQLVSRYYSQQAYTDLRQDNLVQARIDLDAARESLGLWVPPNDRKRIDIVEGDLSFRLAETAKTVTVLLEEMEKAEKLYAAAVAIDPLDLDGYTGLARAIATLEKVYPFVYRRPYAIEALPVFEKLLALMPVNLYSHALLTRYYYSRKMMVELHEIVGRSIALSPQLYYQLRKQPFYSMAMNEMLKTSLLKAIENGVYVKSAYKVLSDLALQEEDYQGAISYFLKTRTVTPYKDNSGYDLRLGKLYLQAEQFPEAEQPFVDSLKTADKERRLNKIWNLYKSREAYNEFLAFCKRVDITNIADFMKILRARCLIEMGRFELANSHLVRVFSQKYAAESLYLQARIAEYQKDWGTMELRSQRATVLEPGNSRYHLLFSKALRNQKKWPQADQAASDAITQSAKPNPWLYNHRAWIRWSRQDFKGAQQDWERAIELSPETAWFYGSMARVFEQGGNIKEAIRHLDKAIALRPDEQRFRKKHDELEKKLHH